VNLKESGNGRSGKEKSEKERKGSEKERKKI